MGPGSDISAVYPWVHYNGFNIWRTPPLVRDAEEHFKRIRNLSSRGDDVLLVTAPKAGTHWVHEILSMLLSQTEEFNKKGNLLSMHLEYQEIDIIESYKGQRLLHSHMPFSYLPRKHIENQCKIVYVNRNPKDRYVSRYKYLCGLKGTPDWTWTEYYNQEIVNDIYATGWFNFTKEMTYALRDSSVNIIQVLYEDLLLKPVKQVTRLAKYLEVPFTGSYINNIVEQTRFDNFKDRKTEVALPYSRDGKSILFRKGMIGDWKNWFTVSQNEEFDDVYQTEMGNINIKFTYETEQQ